MKTIMLLTVLFTSLAHAQDPTMDLINGFASDSEAQARELDARKSKQEAVGGRCIGPRPVASPGCDKVCLNGQWQEICE